MSIQGDKVIKTTRLFGLLLVGVERFELPHVGIRIRSLTAWLYPNIFLCTDILVF